MSNETAGQEPVEKPEGVETQTTSAPEVDAETRMTQILAENKKLAEERDNYRRGMLKAKSRISEEVETEDEDFDAKVARVVEEKLSQTQWAEAQTRLETEAMKLARENKELKKSLANRSQISSTGQGSSQEVTQVQDSKFNPDKISELKKRGWSDKKIELFKKNRLK